MAAAAMLYSGYQAVLNSIDMLLFEVATFLPTLVKIGPKVSERHQFFEMQGGSGRHVVFRLTGISQNHRYVVFRSRNIPNELGENWSQMSERHQFFEIQGGGTRRV